MATALSAPTMKAWQYTNTKGGLEKNLRLNASAALPRPTSSQFLVQVIATALNPVDYKPAEIGWLSRLAIRKPATPGIDFAGYLVTPQAGSPLKRGQLVFGATGTSPLAGGGLAQFALSKQDQVLALPDGIDPMEAATVGVGSLTAYQTIVPHVKEGDRIFLNGGSGGTGIFGIQIGKALGCHVTTTCSTANVELCKSLGADRVIDYKQEDVVDALKRADQPYDHVVDNIGSNMDLYWRCHEYTRPGALYIYVGGELSWSNIVDRAKRTLWPSFLGGGRRKTTGFLTQSRPEDLAQVVAWMKEGKIKTVIDSQFPFEKAPQAFERLKTHRAKGKIVVNVSSEPLKGQWPAA